MVIVSGDSGDHVAFIHFLARIFAFYLPQKFLKKKIPKTVLRLPKQACRTACGAKYDGISHLPVHSGMPLQARASL